ncbi:Protein of unknown function [Bacillus sp. OV322]|nr:Protein of unknown function [Bacillus sp. OV322]
MNFQRFPGVAGAGWRNGMRSSLSLVLHTAKVMVLFVSFTVLFYIGMVWLNQEYQDYHRYDEPKGAAIKVTNAMEPEKETWVDRLMLFYKNGE